MPSRKTSRRLPRTTLTLVLAGLLLAPPPPLRGAERPNEPPYFALRGARIVSVSGPVLESGTVVIARGLIAAVGTDVAIPPEAWVIEGKGLTVYPGLIDSLTTLGLPAPPTPAPGAASFGEAVQQMARQPISRGPEDRPGTTSWENAANDLQLSDKRLETWRKGGFTSAVTCPDRGIFPGQAAFINLAGERPQQFVVKTPAALRVNLTPVGGFWSFPGSLMGVIAYIKQIYLDTEHYAQAWALYEADPKGRERPTYDRALEPFRQAKDGHWPVLIPANLTKEVPRALSLSGQAGVSPILYGGQQGYEFAELAAARKVPVLVSLKWPEKSKDADPEADEPLRELRFRDRAPSSPAAFEKAGVKFAFYSDGLGTPADILKNVKKAIDAGLPAEAALRALTLSAAEIYGVGDRLGSIDAGKIANLVVTDGDLFNEKTKVKLVFVDGAKYEIREPSRPKEPPTVNLTGKWTLTVTTPQGPEERTADLTMTEDGTLSGTVTGPRGSASITTGWVSGAKFSFTLSITLGPRPGEATYTGTVEGAKMSGTVSFGPFTSDFTGKRPDGGKLE